MTISEKERELIEKFKDSNVNDLALRLKEDKDVRPKFVLQQIEGKQVMLKKMPSWADNKEVLYPIHLSLEQCSSMFTADYKANVVENILTNFDNMVDLTGGFGVDFYMVSRNFKNAVYVERDKDLCEIVEHNFNALSRNNASFLNCNGVDFLKSSDMNFNLVFIDPARRDKSGGKTVHIQDCEPNIIEFQDVMISKSEIVVIKLSPMLDISECVLMLKNIREIHVVAANNECKEILVVLDKTHKSEPKLVAVNNTEKIEFYKSEETDTKAIIADNISEGMFLYEPNTAIMKAGAYKLICKKFNVKALHQSSHLYISESEICDFPGRKFMIEKIGSPKDFKDIKKANLAVRNFPMKADELKKKMKIKDGGDVYLFATTLKNDKKIIIKTRK